MSYTIYRLLSALFLGVAAVGGLIPLVISVKFDDLAIRRMK